VLYKYDIYIEKGYIYNLMGKITLNKERLDKLQEIIEAQLQALQQAHFGKEEVRKQISKIIISQFKKYLKIY